MNIMKRRYGFHGTSHDFVSKRVGELLGKDRKDLKIIVCHLGNGASVSAVDHGKSVDTSMGLTPLEGLMMGTRSGDMDPAIVGFIAEKENLTAAEVINICNKNSGVLGLSGISSDFRDLVEAAAAGNDHAQTTLEAYAYRVGKYIGAYAAAMNGVDAIVFTAGIGENADMIREGCLKNLEFLGVYLDKEKNKQNGEIAEISKDDSKQFLKCFENDVARFYFYDKEYTHDDIYIDKLSMEFNSTLKADYISSFYYVTNTPKKHFACFKFIQWKSYAEPDYNIKGE